MINIDCTFETYSDREPPVTVYNLRFSDGDYPLIVFHVIATESHVSLTTPFIGVLDTPEMVEQYVNTLNKAMEAYGLILHGIQHGHAVLWSIERLQVKYRAEHEAEN